MIYYRIKFINYILRGATVAPTSNVYTAIFVVLLEIRNPRVQSFVGL